MSSSDPTGDDAASSSPTAAAAAAAVTLMAVGSAHFLGAVALFVRQRRVFPLSGLSFGLVIMLSSALSFFTLSLAIELFLDPLPCAVPIMLSFPMALLWATSTMARSWRACFLYAYSGDKLRSTTEHYDRESWFARRRHHFSDARLTGYAFLASIPVQLAVIVPWLATVDDASRMVNAVGRIEDGCDSHFSSDAMLVVLVLASVLQLATAFQLRTVKDGYHLRRDGFISTGCFIFMIMLKLLPVDMTAGCFIFMIMLKLLPVDMTAGCFILMIILKFLPVDMTVVRILLAISAQLNLFAVVTWKVLASFRSVVEQHKRVQQRRRRERARKREAQASEPGSAVSEPSRLSISNLADVFGDAALMSEFNEHLRSEFSVENMLFYKRSKAFAQQCLAEKFAWSTEERNREASTIYSEFISRDGELQVNIPSNIYNAIVVELEDALTDFDVAEFRRTKAVKSARPVSPKIFEAACNSIYVLMGSDTFVRFKMKLLRRSSSSEIASAKAQARASLSEVVQHTIRKGSIALTNAPQYRDLEKPGVEPKIAE